MPNDARSSNTYIGAILERAGLDLLPLPHTVRESEVEMGSSLVHI